MPLRVPGSFVAAREWVAVAALALLLGMASDTRAQAANDGASSAPPAAAGQVRSWLLKIHEAASRRNFQGTFVVSGSGAVSSAHIAHFCEAGQEYERSESLDGQARYIYRHNDEMKTVWPAHRLVLVEQRTPLASFPALLQAGDDRIVDFYDVRPQGAGRVAGHDADVLLVKPRDGLRYGYRLWADRASGLLLRADVLGEHHEVVESSAFSDVSIGVKPQPDSVLQPMRRLAGYRVVKAVMTPTRLDAEGWSMPQGVAGFREVSCVRRPMDTGPESPAGEPLPVLQTIYSDGLTYVSVFIEPFGAASHRQPVLASVGATQTLMQQSGDWWITVVGDVPAATLRQFAKGLERKK